jgi:ribose 5-phosphate isomerase B
MKIFLGTDHAGYALKEVLKGYLLEFGHEIKDMGAHEYQGQDDYPDFITLVAEEVSKDTDVRGIILGGSGEGEAMCANRHKGVRAAVYYGGRPEIITLSREHNDANVLSLGARFLNEEEAKEVIKIWLETPFSGEERHKRRIGKIDR